MIGKVKPLDDVAMKTKICPLECKNRAVFGRLLLPNLIYILICLGLQKGSVSGNVKPKAKVLQYYNV